MVVDDKLVEKARKDFGIELPIVVRLVPIIDLENPNTIGQYVLVKAKQHTIIIKDSLTPNRANEVFWHEFGHARQSDEDPNFGAKYTMERRAVGYANLDYERDADEHMENFRHIDVIYPF